VVWQSGRREAKVTMKEGSKIFIRRIEILNCTFGPGKLYEGGYGLSSVSPLGVCRKTRAVPILVEHGESSSEL
jgi:hypothetical protein